MALVVSVFIRRLRDIWEYILFCKARVQSFPALMRNLIHIYLSAERVTEYHYNVVKYKVFWGPISVSYVEVFV